MGLRFVKGLGDADWDAIRTAAAVRPFASLDDFVERTGRDERRLNALAEAGAFACFGLARRPALWRARGLARAAPVALPVDAERVPEFAPLDALETIAWDYVRAHHSTHGHPLQPLRAVLRAMGLPDARTVAHRRHGERVRYAGLVICRQRPGTASGVTFMTLEDETGFVNVVVWRPVFEQYAIVLKTEPFLGVTGRLQVEREVVHVIADSLWKPRLRHTPPSGGSRDFH
jgi:error-prone DNA polymerase